MIARPDDSSFPPDEWALLVDRWHPVAAASDLLDGPFRSVLLDVALVVWRSPDGPVVSVDRCPHRGARLSAGQLYEGVLECPYHGFRFAEGGRCVAVPSAPGGPISSRLDLGALPAVERYGLVWTCLGDADAHGLPEWPQLEDAAFQRGSCVPGVWGASALRHAENFNDLAHFAFVHSATFGSADQTAVPQLQVDMDGDSVAFDVTMVQYDRMTFDGPPEECEVHYEYRWSLPFASLLRIEYPGARTEWICDVAAPVTRSTSRVYVEKSRDHELDQPVGPWIEFQEAVNEEDRRILELLDPAEAPLDLTEEVHVRADTASIAARRWFRDGLRTRVEVTHEP